MIIGIIHKGSGIGDQLFSYIATRVRAADLDVPFGFVGKEFFKGASFMNLDWGNEFEIQHHVEEPSGKVVCDNLKEPFVLDKPYYDPEFNFIKDWRVIDGYGAQDIRYFEHRLDEVREWLKTALFEQEQQVRENVCVINFRGGEYAGVPDLFLPREYWNKAMQIMKDKYPNIKFQVDTDDKELAKQFFPSLPIYRDIGINWTAIRYAKHLIISNSAFAILPALLNENVKEVIAPKFWAGRNVSEWRRPGNYYSKFTYI